MILFAKWLYVVIFGNYLQNSFFHNLLVIPSVLKKRKKLHGIKPENLLNQAKTKSNQHMFKCFRCLELSLKLYQIVSTQETPRVQLIVFMPYSTIVGKIYCILL